MAEMRSPPHPPSLLPPHAHIPTQTPPLLLALPAPHVACEGWGLDRMRMVGLSPHPPPQNCNSPRISPLGASDDPHGVHGVIASTQWGDPTQTAVRRQCHGGHRTRGLQRVTRTRPLPETQFCSRVHPAELLRQGPVQGGRLDSLTRMQQLRQAMSVRMLAFIVSIESSRLLPRTGR